MSEPPRPLQRVLLAALLTALVGLSGGCSLFGRGVDLGVEGVDARWVDLEGGDRRALVATPAQGEAPPDGRPLVVLLHGLGADPEFMVEVSGLPAAVARLDLVVVVPEGVDRSWNAGSCCGTAAADGLDDVEVLRRLITDAPVRFDVDPSRVYLVGYSNGAMMVHRFLCTDAALVAGAASVAGTDVAGCDPSAPVSFLEVAGRRDTVVPLDGGDSSAPDLGPFPSVRDSVAGVAAAASCPPPRTGGSAALETTIWSPCADGVTVALDVVAEGDHGWSVDEPYPTIDRVLAFWGLA